jgi:hypothetical protein
VFDAVDTGFASLIVVAGKARRGRALLLYQSSPNSQENARYELLAAVSSCKRRPFASNLARDRHAGIFRKAPESRIVSHRVVQELLSNRAVRVYSFVERLSGGSSLPRFTVVSAVTTQGAA